MVELLYWRGIVVRQRYQTGCIPAGYEWIIRYLDIKGIDLETFQEDFDIQRRGEGMNTFVTIAEKVRQRYPFLDIRVECFDQGIEKIRVMKSLIARDVPCLISLALHGFRTNEGQVIERGWHIMPVVSIGDLRMKMIHKGTENGNDTLELTIEQVIRRHEDLEGGKDISWIETKTLSPDS
jgi:hypothetical protein